MKNKAPGSDVVRLIRFSSFLWLGYLVVMMIINQTFQTPQRTDPMYYTSLGYIALICLGLSYWDWAQKKMGRFFLPLVIVIIAIMPVIISYLLGAVTPFGPRFDIPESQVLAMFPFLFVALMLVAWQYKWQYMLLVILGIAGLNTGVVWFYTVPGSPPFQGGMIITLIQMVILLAVGFSVSYLMSRLKEKQRSLETANIRLEHYTSTLESLATSRERNRVARELHDTLAHTLSGLSVQLETVKAYWDVDRETSRSNLDKCLSAAHLGLEETRRALKALRASPLDDLGLALAVRMLAEDASSRGNLSLSLSVSEDLPALAPDVEQCIYRVAQEATTNVLNHAGAKNLEVKLENANDELTLSISDDGIGFDSVNNSKADRFGLAGMRERAGLIGAILEIKSQPGCGTKVKLTFPTGGG